ncbi:GNAT family N-acetyltransferase [Natronorubrum texcoconense]|uniref:Protein N-acetyltransferase, RimJ/RimL family n=1 Tax=Natronorubrum texcoconense TaxID=1095776 RepID=A0A1G9DE75_9EURY|nr:GNAT family protein [Natronorubrum texcoconense]SDK62127.1 Protein N-acetyltransferase, RimJ/RimL family [Natronorubrum texcoconense]
MDIDPVTLEAETIRLEPLSVDDHLADLQANGSQSIIFRWFGEDISGPEAMRDWVTAAVEDGARGRALPFATVSRETGEAIGSTRFGAIQPAHRSVEIGWTWLTPDYWRTAANTEAKYLMLEHAFEEWDCVRVEFKTDSRNRRSRAAIERLGATQEGIHRQHRHTHQGLRDSVYFSVLDTEWPGVKRRLLEKLDD